MEEDYSTINNSNELTPSNSHRLSIRRNLLRQTTTLRSAPYHSTLSHLRQRQNSLIASQTINQLITNIDHNSELDILSTTDHEDIPDEEIEVLVDLSQTSPNDLAETNHAIDFDHDYYYYHHPSTTIPILNSTSIIEPISPPTNPLNLIQYPYDDEDDEYSPSINNNNNNNINDDDDDDLSIEIILESSQNNSLPAIPRRRRSIIPSNTTGLRLSDILNIPQKLFSSFKQQYHEKYPFNTQCYICLEDFQLIDSIKILHCQHIFHTACINEWLRSHSNCAYCRTAVVIDMLRPTTTGRRQRTRARRNLIRSSTSNPIESSTFDEEEEQQS